MQAPSAKQARKAVELSASLQRDLAAYALAVTGALAFSQPAEAQIVYTPTHELLTKDGHISIDLNNDGVSDVTVREIFCTLGAAAYFNSLQANPEPGGGVVQADYTLGFAKAMSAGSAIGGRDTFISSHALMGAESVYGVYYYGYWPYAGPKYLGIRFLIGTEVHYGWARIRATYEHTYHHIAALLTGYAYETRPNAPIPAGATGQGNEIAASPEPSSVRPRPKATLGALARGASPHIPHCGSE